MQRAISDHTPLLVDLGEATHVAHKNAFSFESGWFEKEFFLEIIAREWAKPVNGSTNIERWQNKIRHLRQFLRGWARNESGIYKQEKERLTQLIEALDLKVESNLLTVHEKNSKSKAEQGLWVLLR